MKDMETNNNKMEGGYDEKFDPYEKYNALKEEIRSMACLSLQFAMIWFGSNYFYNYGLDNTSVTSSTVLSNTSSIFVYLLSLLLIRTTKFSLFRASMVICSFLGIVIIAYTD